MRKREKRVKKGLGGEKEEGDLLCTGRVWVGVGGCGWVCVCTCDERGGLYL